MNFIGICSAITLAFGLLSAVVLTSDPFFLVPVHLAIGSVLLAIFLARGGLRTLFGSARRVRFGLGVTLYSSLFVGVLAVVNVIAYRYPLLSLDTTEDGVFTLAPESEQVLSDIQGRLEIRAFYLGGKITDSKLEELLRRIERRFSNVSLEVIDPERRPTLLQRYQITDPATLHFSLEGESRQVRISGSLDEQDVINAIKKLTRKEERTVYYITGHGEPDIGSSSFRGYALLKEAIAGENIRLLPLLIKEAIPPNAAAVILSAPQRPLLPHEQAALTNYLQAGGNALVLNDVGVSTNLESLLQPFGFSLGNDVVVDQRSRQVESGEMGLEPMITNFGKHPLTEGFQQSVVLSTTTSVKGPEVLARTSESSWAERDLQAIFSDDPRARFDEQDEKGPVSVAAASTGKGRIAVFGDAEFVNNQNIRQLFNRDLALNALNWVVGEEKGVSIRARSFRASMTHLSTDQLTVFFLFTTVILPEALLLGGVSVWWWRRKSG